MVNFLRSSKRKLNLLLGTIFLFQWLCFPLQDCLSKSGYSDFVISLYSILTANLLFTLVPSSLNTAESEGSGLYELGTVLLSPERLNCRRWGLGQLKYCLGFSGTSEVKILGSIPGSGRSPREGNGNLLPYSCLGSPIDRGAWQATVQKKVGRDLETNQILLPFSSTDRRTSRNFSPWARWESV